MSFIQIGHFHPHFNAYSNFYYGDFLGYKAGFCIQTTDRDVNSRYVSSTTPYFTCNFQGVSAGWSDNYNIGIPCEWVDITDVPATVSAPVTNNLTLVNNPKNWVCEGTSILDSNGNFTWTPTGELTSLPLYDVAGKSIDKRQCIDTPGALNDNIDSQPVTIREHGQGYLTSTCLESGHTYGPKRDCEMTLSSSIRYKPCIPGSLTYAKCSLPSGSASQVLRICEASTMLKAGTACRYMDDSMLANRVIDAASDNVSFTFQCPTARGVNETGGYFALYSGPVLNRVDSYAPPACTFLSGSSTVSASSGSATSTATYITSGSSTVSTTTSTLRSSSYVSTTTTTTTPTTTTTTTTLSKTTTTTTTIKTTTTTKKTSTTTTKTRCYGFRC